MASIFGSTGPLSSTNHKNKKLQNILVQESESTFTFESYCSKASVLPFLCFLCSSSTLESLHTEAKASSIGGLSKLPS